MSEIIWEREHPSSSDPDYTYKRTIIRRSGHSSSAHRIEITCRFTGPRGGISIVPFYASEEEWSEILVVINDKTLVEEIQLLKAALATPDAYAGVITDAVEEENAELHKHNRDLIKELKEARLALKHAPT